MRPQFKAHEIDVSARSSGQVIGSFLKEKRVARGLSPEDVTAHLELPSIEILFQYETGQCEIPLQTLFALSNLYSVSPDQLVLLLYKQALRAENS